MDLLFFVISGQIVIALVLSFLCGLISYFISKLLIKKNIKKNPLYCIVLVFSILVMIVGFLLFLPTQIFVEERMFGREWCVGQDDRNRDGKNDKWVYANLHNVKRIDYDNNFDGRIDVRDYYNNGRVYKREVDTDFDEKLDRFR